MVLTPGEDKFNQLRELLKSKGTWDGGDQGLLNEWRGNNWNRLSFTYNTTPTAAYTYAPAYERFGSQISAIHFIGPKKPWHAISFRSPFSSQPVQTATNPQQAYDYDSLVDQWCNVYDRHYRSKPVQRPHFEARRYEPAWNQTGAPPPSQDVLSLDELRRLAIEGMSAASATPYHLPLDEQHTGGQYQSMPLEGRVDLMRPKAEASVEASSTMDVADEPKEEKRSKSLSTPSEEDPRTPVPRIIALPEQTPPRWHTLPTPGPNELPPSPHMQPIPLPPVTPAVERDTPTLLSFSTPTVPDSPSNRLSKLRLRQSEHDRILSPLPAIFTKPEQRKAPTRPHSPTMLLWNPAIEPPPTEAPAVTAFPANPYFPNAWDASPVKPDQQTHRESRTILPDSQSLFEPLPRPEIPETLIKQGHYRNVTGENQEGASPSPDSTKVKPVFPWEERPRHLPGRVFPSVDSPKPALFLSPESQSSRTSSELPATPEMKPGTPPPVLSPLHAPPSFTFPNAWDSVPSIKKYASRLVRPPPTQTLAPAFEEGWEKVKNTWDDKVEASSRDGDVEDEGEDSEEEKAVEEEDEKSTEDIQGSKSTEQTRSRRSSSAPTIRTSAEPVRYLDVGVQTEVRELKTQGVQTIPVTPQNRNIEAAKKPTFSGKRHWAPTSRPNIPPSITMHDTESAQGESQTSTAHFTAETRLRSPQPGLRSPSMRLPIPSPPVHPGSASNPQKYAMRVASSPAGSVSAISRQASNDSSLASPISSISPLSLSEGQPVGSPRKGGRVWDPARGVELFKRGSEEVLARFLKMGSWEDER
ncbi:hypothetical protein C0993_010135 [Termitomyces sp. T159_Od127]|nr:hypothetical protein C0993_010135 [Termitomyces sp. T159_Od127]